jgi:hypothetical protein
MPVPSDQSYEDFVKAAFIYFADPVLPPKVYAGRTIRNLYNRYAAYDSDPAVPAKVPLAGNALYAALVSFIDNVGNRIVRVQSDDWNILNNVGVRAEYQARVVGGNAPLSQTAGRARGSYLHVYPTGTTANPPNGVTPPHGRAVSNWRIGINVQPNSIAGAAQALVGIMDANNDIGHIKFSGPRSARKPDSVIVYMRKRRQTYANLRATVQNAVRLLNIQPKFSPMWNEFVPGLAEAAEPPRHGGSFGNFRCTLAYLAYPEKRSESNRVGLVEYQDLVDQTFEVFGIPRYQPHEQEPLPVPIYDDAWRRRFMRAFASYKGVDPIVYRNTQLTDR